jgi:hypothetical protein
VGPFGGGSGGVGRGGSERDRFGGPLGAEKAVAPEARVPLPTLRIEDPERRSLPRRPVPVAGNERLGALADDIAPEPDPRPANELEPEPGRLGHGGRKAGTEVRRLEDDEEGVRPTGEGRQPMEPVRDAGRAIGTRQAGRQIDEEEVDRASGQERGSDREAFVERRRGDDDEPLEPDPAGDRLDRVEAPGEIEPGDDPAGGLGLRRDPESQRRPTARAAAPDGHARAPRKSTGPEDRVELGEPGRDDPFGRVAAGDG